MTLKEAGVQLKSSLINYYDIREAAAIADLVLEDLTGLRRVDRILQDKQPLTMTQLWRLKCAIKLLQQKMPVQYVLGYAYFGGLRLKVNNQVLIPRPETEELVEWIVTTIMEESSKSGSPYEKLLLDLGTGSGCIPLAVKRRLPELFVSGCDISDGALGVARHNARLSGLNVDFFKLDILDAQSTEKLPPLDYIVSNPPYIHFDEKLQMEAHVLDFEPHLALFPDKTLPATIFYQKISYLASKRLKPGGHLFMEINPLFVNEIREMLKSAGAVHIEIRKDLQGKDRMVKSVFK
ncbi:peptide chain release factor N(5)-glutamine methyltransferase [Arachidicoccus ginsenosidivorans]|jgi:release factor glutamine methyltransferase|uniref:peptide chain release factor N(5)-glutamine methyltransferase n=1 Tax=Arachidicoccus ginsenosidivorans TaxID=496057 RepID=A0A5B8VHD6_9BACT|nr:peptide chain release factor N(5)-glutamine methyltransferase [Arachidicoccus ginsenosidivorans]QEC70583.1 peptide chain release factor N(5)-glutamine methyltransferase [Arachidicoccus ginsenosidivorans]